MISDIYSLLQHLRDEELKAHNHIDLQTCEDLCPMYDRCIVMLGYDMVCYQYGRMEFARELIDRIENSPNQRPHIK